MFTNEPIPTSGVYISEAYSPKGFIVGRYDSEGFISNQRWFDKIEKAEGYAKTIN